MSISPLGDLVSGNRDWTIHVYVSRLWLHRGASDDGPIKHIDIVFQDVEASYIYGEIAAPLVNHFIDKIEEGKIYEISRFLVSKMKGWYRPVDCELMIKFGKYTIVKELDNNIMDYPLCTYALTPIDQLPGPTDNPTSFTDVIGIITGVSAIFVYHSASRTTPSTNRIIYLSDLSGFQITLVLWGERAHAFDGESVLQIAKAKPVVVVFVGTFVKPFESRRGLSGGAPCRWYINEKLSEINRLLTQLQDRLPVIRDISLPGQSAAEISSQVDLETKTVDELVNIDTWKYRKSRFYCTVVLTKLCPGERWWFHACTACGKSTMPFGSAYKCPDKDCGAVGGAPRYRLCYVASDGTSEVNIMFFEKAGKELIGKAPMTIMRSRVPSGVSMEDAIQFARTDQSTPRELAAVVSRNYRLVVSLTSKSLQPEVEEKAYQVVRIDEQYGKQPRSAALGRRPGLILASTSTSTSGGSGSIPGGQALAGDLSLTNSNYSGTIPDATDAAASAEMPASTVDPRSIILQTPPSVTKPDGPSDDRSGVTSSIKKALFQGPPSEDETGVVRELTDLDHLAKVDLPLATSPTSALVSPTGPAEKTITKRRQNTKAPVDAAGKKAKTTKN